MTPSTATPELTTIADLPATIAGLWTAITMTQAIAEGLIDDGAPTGDAIPARFAASCAQAAEGLAASRREALVPSAQLPDARAMEQGDQLAVLGALSSGCIDLAVDVLGNEDEPMTPLEVLAVTRAVTALCTARTLTEGRAA